MTENETEKETNSTKLFFASYRVAENDPIWGDIRGTFLLNFAKPEMRIAKKNIKYRYLVHKNDKKSTLFFTPQPHHLSTILDN